MGADGYSLLCIQTRELAGIAFSKSIDFDCSISQPCTSFHVPSALNTVMCVSNYSRLPPWLALYAHSWPPFPHTNTSVLTFFCSSVSGCSLHCKEAPLIPIVMTSTETTEAVCKSPLVCLRTLLLNIDLWYSVVCRSAPCYQFACHRRDASIQMKGSFANATKDTAALGPEIFSKPFSSTVEAYN